MSFWRVIVVSLIALAAAIAWEVYAGKRRLRRIREYCAESGCEDVKIQVWKNHYSVTFRKGGRTYRAKCRVPYPGIEWLTNDPAEVGANP